MVLPRPARLSVLALSWLLEVERIGEPHVVLASTAVWRPPADEDRLWTGTREEIAALGWYDRSGRLDVEVAAALAMLCRAEAEFFGWITHGQATVGALAAGLGRHGLLAVREGDSVWLKHIGRHGLADALVGQAPDVAPGSGKPVTVARTDVRASVRGQRITATAVRVGPASAAVRRVQQLIALPRTGAGELYAAARDGVGRYRVGEPVRYADTHAGRYLNVNAGRDQLLVAPAGPADLVIRLHEALPG